MPCTGCRSRKNHPRRQTLGAAGLSVWPSRSVLPLEETRSAHSNAYPERARRPLPSRLKTCERFRATFCPTRPERSRSWVLRSTARAVRPTRERQRKRRDPGSWAESSITSDCGAPNHPEFRGLRRRLTRHVQIQVKVYLDRDGKVEYAELLSSGTRRRTLGNSPAWPCSPPAVGSSRPRTAMGSRWRGRLCSLRFRSGNASSSR